MAIATIETQWNPLMTISRASATPGILARSEDSPDPPESALELREGLGFRVYLKGQGT